MEVEGSTPNYTLYVNNLNDKIKQERLRQSLYAAFAPYGKIADIVSSKARSLRGQAWIVYEDISCATTAMRQMQGFEFFEKPMRIQFSKSKSDAIAKKDGTYKPREKRQREEKPKETHAPSKSTNATAAPAVLPPQKNMPNKILFVENLPDDCNQEMLSVLFRQYHGFKEVRMVPGKKGLAFIEFGDEAQAGIALQGLYGFKLSASDNLHVSFARK